SPAPEWSLPTRPSITTPLILQPSFCRFKNSSGGQTSSAPDVLPATCFHCLSPSSNLFVTKITK
ncbi:MAG: hypothetical protein KC441_20505, partial [Anaerolineales bacterium]|nr:hypothetical protein [Anaerolineales bacterium]